MGIYVDDNKGASTSTSNGAGGSLPVALAQLTTAEAIQLGDVVSQGSDGLIYWGGDPSQPAYAHPLANVATQTNVQAAAPTTTPVTIGSRVLQDSVVLTNGNLVIASINAAGALYIEIYGPTGNTVASPILVASGVTYNTTYPESAFSLVAQSTGGFAIGYLSAAGAMLSIRNAAGIQSYSVNAIPGAGYRATNLAIAVCELSGGNILVVGGTVNVSSTEYIQAAIVSAAGSIVVAAMNVAGGGALALSTVTSVAVCICGTGFLFAWAFKNGGNNTYAYATVFSSAGVILNGPTTLLTAAGVQDSVNVQAINAGGYAVVSTSGGIDSSWTASPTLRSYTSAGALVGTAAFGGAASGTYGVCLAANGTNVTAFAQTGSTLYCNVFQAATGAYTSQSPTSIATGLTANALGLSYGALTDGTGILTNAAGDVVHVSGATLIGSVQNVPALNTIWGSTIFGVTAANMGLGSSYGASWRIYGAAYMTQFCSTVIPRSPLGVATAAAAAGATATVQVLGALSTRLSFKAPYAIDARSYAIPGQRMSVIGNMAIMLGIQATTTFMRNID